MKASMRFDQLAKEQRVVLRQLAKSISHDSCRMLEIGSWCGDSTIVLGQVARNNNGRLFCVDWWKGSPETDLANCAQQRDVFEVFWRRMKREGLTDTVVPIRTSSDVAAQVLRQRRFDLVFIDGDHRYEQVRRDIANYGPMLKPGGILCGHDCEGWVQEYDNDLLRTGKDCDYYQNLHCGVILAVGEAFEDVSINCAIWSVRASHIPGRYKPTMMRFSELPYEGEPPPVLIETCGAYNLIRYRGKVHAVAHAAGEMNIASVDAQRALELHKQRLWHSTASLDEARIWVDDQSNNK